MRRSITPTIIISALSGPLFAGRLFLGTTQSLMAFHPAMQSGRARGTPRWVARAAAHAVIAAMTTGPHIRGSGAVRAAHWHRHCQRPSPVPWPGIAPADVRATPTGVPPRPKRGTRRRPRYRARSRSMACRPQAVRNRPRHRANIQPPHSTAALSMSFPYSLAYRDATLTVKAVTRRSRPERPHLNQEPGP